MISATKTQDFVPIEEIRDGIIILTDGTMKAILMASSINLALKSAEEQQAVIAQFQTFLNSLDFSVQIVVQSRRYEIRPYLLMLEERMKAQTEPLLKVQTHEYMEFIREFTDQVAVMKKTFFLVIPYSGATISSDRGGLFDKIFGKKKTKQEASEEGVFAEERTQLEQRIAVVEQGLNRIGVRTVQLGTEEVIELFYKTFNPGETAPAIKKETIEN